MVLWSVTALAWVGLYGGAMLFACVSLGVYLKATEGDSEI